MREVSAIGSVMRKIRSRREKRTPVEGSLAGRLPPRGAGSNFFRKFKHKACGQVRLQGAPGGEQCNPFATRSWSPLRSEEHTSELQSRENLVCRLLLEKKKMTRRNPP